MIGDEHDHAFYGTIAVIQDRAGEGGGLSLAEDQGGQLSLAPGGELVVAGRQPPK
jgi:hypothetical protein